jgi:hypothetical protein
MYFRCTDCYGATWVQDAALSSAGGSLRCKSCGTDYKVPATTILREDARTRYETALALAEGNGFDLPTAYSVMLGIVTLERAADMRDRGVPQCEDETPAAAGNAPSSLEKLRAVERSGGSAGGGLPVVEYDPAFEEAVRQGYLTIQQAVERGERVKYARRLAERHGLELSLAYLVADNRTSLASALRKEREEVQEILRPVQRAVWKKALVAVVASLAAVAIGVHGFYVWSKIERENEKVQAWARTVAEKQQKQEQEQERERTESESSRESALPVRRVRLQKDEFGRLIEIEGPDPSSVLMAFCDHRFPGGRLKPIELTAGIPPRPGAQLGVFEDREALGKRFAIPIRRKPRDSRWIAGDGRNPIDPVEAPILAPDARHTPVLTGKTVDSDS